MNNKSKQIMIEKGNTRIIITPPENESEAPYEVEMEFYKHDLRRNDEPNECISTQSAIIEKFSVVENEQTGINYDVYRSECDSIRDPFVEFLEIASKESGNFSVGKFGYKAYCSDPSGKMIDVKDLPEEDRTKLMSKFLEIQKSILERRRRFG